ncbi:hypothetical protein [Streptomyces hainanensis]|nr:hypothetical protein [Streptomyces hainanensis]
MATLLRLDEDELRALYGESLTASHAVEYVKHGPANHILTDIIEGASVNG